jgi:hypothetical protein
MTCASLGKFLSTLYGSREMHRTPTSGHKLRQPVILVIDANIRCLRVWGNVIGGGENSRYQLRFFVLRNRHSNQGREHTDVNVWIP